ncbi:MAG TPA: hypothetical protein VFW50_24140 [Streptosporangiaceae bacterium]|nr:hypothetical protein [Streptosporangiaceae bacterium]
MNGNVRDLVLVARREVTTRMRGTVFRLSTVVLLACTVAGIAIPAALIGHPHRFTVAVTAQAHPDTALQPALNAAIQEAVITRRAASLGLSPDAAARLLAPVRILATQLHADTRRTGRVIVGEVGMILLYMAITFHGSFVL